MSRTLDAGNTLEPDLGAEILKAVAALDFGAVEVTVHQGRVVSLEIRAKRRFEAVRKDVVPGRAARA